MLVCGLVHNFAPHWNISTTIRLIVMQVWGPLTFEWTAVAQVACSIPLVFMSKCPLARYWTPKLLLMCRSAPCMAATAISVWMYVWITVSCFGQKRLLNDLNINVNEPTLGPGIQCCNLVGTLKSTGFSSKHYCYYIHGPQRINLTSFGPDWNIPTLSQHSWSKRMKSTDFGDLLTCLHP